MFSRRVHTAPRYNEWMSEINHTRLQNGWDIQPFMVKPCTRKSLARTLFTRRVFSDVFLCFGERLGSLA